MRVLITGAAGFIGSHLADRLLADGYTVCGVDNFSTGSIKNTPCHSTELMHADHAGIWRVAARDVSIDDGAAHYASARKYAIFSADIGLRYDLYRIANAFGPELVIHCAASYSDPNKWHRDTDTNVAGTINATLVAKHHNARLFYFQTALPPISSYAISKIAGGQYITLSGVDSLTFRLSNIYGPRNLSGPIPTFYKRLSAGQACIVTDTRRDMVYVGNLVQAVMNALEKPRVSGTLDICSGTHRPITELYDAVAGYVCGEFPPRAELIPKPADDVAQMQLDPSRAFAELDWKPFHTPLPKGVRAACDWYVKHGVGDTYTHLALKG